MDHRDSRPTTASEVPSQPILRYVDLEFDCEALGELSIRRFVTNTIRGGFGYRLKELICVSPKGNCPTCMLRSSCIYTRTFETACAHLPTDGPFVSPPPPYVINFEFAEAGLDLKARDRFRFGLRVFGDVTAYVPYFLVAFFRLGESGIGRDLTPFRILTIHALGPDDEREEIFRWGEPIRRPRVADLPYQTEPHPLRGVIVYLHTPTRIKKDRGFVDEKEIGLVDLVHAAERRIALLQRFYDPDRTLLPLDRSTLAGIRIESRDLDWQAWSRTSTRSGPMVWPGVVGKLELSGPVSEVARLLRAASKTNIGSKAAFGLGAIEVRPVE